MEATAANRAYCQKSPGLATGSYGLLRAGTITATKGSGQTLTITPGTTWSPRHTRRRAILIHINAHEIRQLISSLPGLAGSGLRVGHRRPGRCSPAA
jgi:hypothetical protein